MLFAAASSPLRALVPLRGFAVSAILAPSRGRWERSGPPAYISSAPAGRPCFSRAYVSSLQKVTRPGAPRPRPVAAAAGQEIAPPDVFGFSTLGLSDELVAAVRRALFSYRLVQFCFAVK